MDHSLAHCGRTCGLGYLAYTNPANIAFYMGFVFEVVGEIQIDGSPVLTRMLRKAA